MFYALDTVSRSARRVEKVPSRFKIKLAAVSMMPLAFFCSSAAAQQQTPDNGAKSSQLKPQAQTPTPLNTEPRQGVSAPDAAVIPNTAPAEGAITDVLPTACPTPVYAVPPGDIYGSYVPYVAPAQPTVCTTPNPQAARSNSSHPNSSAVQKQQPDGLIKSTSPSPFTLAQPTSNDLALASDAKPSTDGSPIGSGYVRPVPTQRAPTIPPEVRPFRSVAVGFKASTLGAGIELATPVAGRINLRSTFNLFAFDDPFSMDGINYNARLHLQSSETVLDWFVGHELHISPGILYVKNTMSAPASVGPGQSFVLGTQTYINSVDDPVSGSSSVVFPRTFAPMLLLGYGNIIPRSGRHLSVPFEFGAAYTGVAQINVALSGTACTTNGCTNFAANSPAQSDVKQEIIILNEGLKRFPVFPIVSLGLAYHF